MLKIAIIGLPNVGKSTLFNALTDGDALAANFPFATIEPNTGIVPVRDDRLDRLAQLYHTDKIVPATVEFVDVAGLVAGASKGDGLGNKFLANIRDCNAICHVVRGFSDESVQRADGSTAIDPKGDIEVINTELALSDVSVIETHLPKLQREVKGNPKLQSRLDCLRSVQSQLLEGKTPAEYSTIKPDELKEKLDGLSLLTALPTIYLFNISEADLSNTAYQDELRQMAADATGQSTDDIRALFICAELESEIRALPENEAAELLADYGITDSGLDKLTRAAYATLGLQSFLTAGPKEVHAWTIHQGWTAPQAAGVIHSDFERGFIAAQIVDYDDLIHYGSEAAARAAGKVRVEGKTYVMRPGDVVEFRFNV